MRRKVRKGDIVKVQGFREKMEVLGRRGNIVEIKSTKYPRSYGFVSENMIKKVY